MITMLIDATYAPLCAPQSYAYCLRHGRFVSLLDDDAALPPCRASASVDAD